VRGGLEGSGGAGEYNVLPAETAVQAGGEGAGRDGQRRGNGKTGSSGRLSSGGGESDPSS
jgi:hypothetical protein